MWLLWPVKLGHESCTDWQIFSYFIWKLQFKWKLHSAHTLKDEANFLVYSSVGNIDFLTQYNYEYIWKIKFPIFVYEYPVFGDKYLNIFEYLPFTKDFSLFNTYMNILKKSNFQYVYI